MIFAFAARAGVFVLSRPWSEDYKRLYIFADACTYHNLAIELMQNGSWSRESKARVTVYAPGYPMFLGFLYKVFGVNMLAALMVNVILSTITCLLIILIVRAVFGSTAGLVAGVLFALHPHSIRFTAMLYSETLYMLLVACLLGALVLGQLHLQRRLSWLWMAVASLAAALSVTTRISMLYFAPLIALMFYIFHRQSWKSTVVRIAAFCALMLLWLSPWALHTKREFGTHRLSVSGEVNFLVLTGAGSLSPNLDFYHSYRQQLLEEAYAAAGKADARTTFEASPYFLRLAYAKIQERPIEFACGMVKRFFNLWFRPIQSRSDRASELLRDMKNLSHICYSYLFQGLLFIGWCASILMYHQLPRFWVVLSVLPVLYFWVAVGNSAYLRFFLQALPYVLPAVSAAIVKWISPRGVPPTM